jgi:RNA polymerase sigma factor (sigma-70 family)
MQPDDLFENHLHLASRIVSGYRNIPGLEAEDIRSVAQAALSRAAHSYRPERGEFTPFANTAIRNALNTLHQQQQRRASNLHFEADLSPDPGQETDATTSLVERFADSSADVILQARRGEARAVLDRHLAALPERTRQILLWVGEGCSYSEIGTRLGISKQAANKIAQEAMAHIREQLHAVGYQGIDSAGVLATARRTAPQTPDIFPFEPQPPPPKPKPAPAPNPKSWWQRMVSTWRPG